MERLVEEARRPIDESIREALRDALKGMYPEHIILKRLYTFDFRAPGLEEMLREIRRVAGDTPLVEELEHVAKRAADNRGREPADG